jgi:hypothetical protein
MTAEGTVGAPTCSFIKALKDIGSFLSRHRSIGMPQCKHKNNESHRLPVDKNAPSSLVCDEELPAVPELYDPLSAGDLPRGAF